MLPDISGYYRDPETGSLQVIRPQIPVTLHDIHNVLNVVFYLGCVLSVGGC